MSVPPEGQEAAKTAGQGGAASRLQYIPLWRAAPTLPGRPAHQPSAAYRLVREISCQVSSWTDCRWMSPASTPSAVCRHSRVQRAFIALRRNRRAAPGRLRPIPAVSGMGRNVHPSVPRRHAAFRRQGSARWTPRRPADMPRAREKGPRFCRSANRLLRDCERMTTCPCEKFPHGKPAPPHGRGRREVRG